MLRRGSVTISIFKLNIYIIAIITIFVLALHTTGIYKHKKRTSLKTIKCEARSEKQVSTYQHIN